ncbi:MAG TPA: hypothetical protein VFR15_00645 [Chloroflexia bacterium]|nr:hypothetical protein [Chloroflexia bacterium]
MESVIKPPIIVVCDVVYVFDTLAKAESYIEPVDADDCTAYDSEGRLLRLLGAEYWEQSRAQNKSSTFKEQLAQLLKSTVADPQWTKIIPAEAEPMHALEATEAIRNRLIGLNEPLGKKWSGLGLSTEWLASASLPELIEYVRNWGGDI